jgi:TolB protein
MDLSSGKEERVSKVGGYNASPEWSPDGRYLAYFGIRSGQSSIYRLDLTTGEEKRVTPETIKAEQPSWSPDGSMIAFTGEERGTKKIYYTLSSGGEIRRMTNSGAGIEESDPAWGPALQ